MKHQAVALVAPFDDEGRLLLLKRGEEQHCADLWSFPGGKIQSGETPQAAATRELKEETGLSGSNWTHIGEYQHVYPDRQLTFFLFRCTCRSNKMLTAESVYAWINIDDIANYPMPEANRELISMLNT